MSTRKSATSLVLVLTLLTVFACVRSVRAQCQPVCVTGFTTIEVECGGPGCKGTILIQVPESNIFGFNGANCEYVGCCSAQIPTWYYSGAVCLVRVKGKDGSGASEQAEAYLFVRGCDGKYRLTTSGAWI
jgi:hypothetical protein